MAAVGGGAAAAGEGEGWLSGEEAAGLLGCSLRAVQRRAEAGELRTAKRAARGSKARTVYSLADVERLRGEMSSVDRAPALLAPAAGGSAVGALPPILATIGEALRAGMQTARPRRWQTLEEASQSSGLTPGFLKRLAAQGEILATRDGREWKVERESLEAWRPVPPRVERPRGGGPGGAGRGTRKR